MILPNTHSAAWAWPGLRDNSPKIIHARQVKDAVSRHLNISQELIESPSRSKEIAYARHLSMYILHKATRLTLKQISALFNRGDHTTASNAIKNISWYVKTDTQGARSDIHYIMADLRGLTIKDI